jgi:hypothetical protein
MKVPFYGHIKQYHAIKAAIDSNIQRVLESGQYVMGPIVVLVNADRVDKLGVVVLLQVSFRPHIVGPLCVCFRLAAEPRSSAA